MDTMIKEDLFTKQTSRLQENFFSDFLGLWFNGSDLFLSPMGQSWPRPQ
jgi:hypothetical protein